jgi:hypothetical protein
MDQITSPYYATVGQCYMHSTGYTIEPRRKSGDTVWVIVLPSGALLSNPTTGKPKAYTSAAGAMRVVDAIHSEEN